MEFLRDEGEEASKILFTGLDGAGKTSIILALQREFSKIALLSPTRGAQRRIFEYLGKDIAEWDLGGQESYRIAYIKNPDKYFDGTEIAIYVIDILDKDRFAEAISYLIDVIEQFALLEIFPPLFVFFHKFDPALIKSSLNEMNNTLLNLKEKIKKHVDYKKMYFYQTSIYDMSTVINAMSEILLTLYPKSELLQKTVAEFAKKVNSEGAVVIDSNSLVISSYYENDSSKELMSASTPYFLALNDSFQGREEKPPEGLPEDQMVIQRFGKYFIFKQIPIKKEAPSYYLLLVKNTQEYSQDEFDSFARLLQEILYR